jgi:hypothetical protein
VESREALFFGAQAELREKGAIFKSGSDYTFAESGYRFGDDANALLVFGRKKKRAEEWAMDTIAESELGGSQALEELVSETR